MATQGCHSSIVPVHLRYPRLVVIPVHPCIGRVCLIRLVGKMSLSGLCCGAIDDIASMVMFGQVHVDPDLQKWEGEHLIHVEIMSRWATECDVVLIDRNLPNSLGWGEMNMVEPKQVCSLRLSLSQLPVWNVSQGDQFACKAELSVSGSQRHASVASVHHMWLTGKRKEGKPLNMVHLFGGAFNGWYQVCRFLDANGVAEVRSTVMVDSNKEVCCVAQKTMNAQLIEHPYTNVAGGHFGTVIVNTEIESPIWRCAIIDHENAMWTASPPCQPYSKSNGKQIGLDSRNGRAVLHVFSNARASQPICITLENVDQFQRHAHFKIIKMVARWAGYVLVWFQTHCLSEMSNCFRNRFIGVFFDRI